MDTKALKDKILQLAIQGKLVPQDENDEPVSVLLEKIKAEKERLIKEKVIKKEKPLPEISEEEKLFELPKGWEWVRLGDITKIYLGLTHRPEYVDKGIPFLSVKDISGGKILFENCKYIEENKFNSMPIGSKPIKGDVLFGRVGTLGKPSIVDIDFPFGIFVSLGFLRPFIIDMNKYLKIFMESQLFFDQIHKNVSGVAQVNLNTGWLNNFVIPLPPLEEQKRIVAKVDSLFKLIDELDNNKQDLLQNISDTRNKVLQLAIQGKLVKQDENDESASILLEKIKEEKERLIKEKVIKKEKPLPEISEEEKLFDLPNGWEWARLGNLGNIFNGNSINAKLKESKYSNIKEGYNYIATKDIDLKSRIINYENGIKIPFNEEKFRIAHKGAVLICAEGASAGKKIGLVKEDICFGNKLLAIELFYKTNSKYLFYLYQSTEFSKIFSNLISGIVGGISSKNFKEISIPLPPLEEQKRIVAKVDTIMNYLDELEKQINQ